MIYFLSSEQTDMFREKWSEFSLYQ